MLHHLIQVNYATLLLLFLLFVFIVTNRYFERRIRRIFLTAVGVLFAIVIADSVEYWTASFAQPTTLRIWMSAIGYTLRPAAIFQILIIFIRKKEANWALLASPLLVNMVIAFSALFTDIAYSYSATNEYVRGPLGWFAYVISGLYFIILMILTVKRYRVVNISESFVVMIVLLMFIFATTMEVVYQFDGMINTTGAVAILFYYLYLNTQQFKRDALTHALNRRCFYLDAENNIANLTAMISIDLNDLKQINDEEGHAEGDKAICTITSCIQRVLLRDCFLYRIGGDEFMILCFREKKNAVEEMLEKIKREMQKTQYTCAMGVVYTQEQTIDFEKLCSLADKAMYEEKARMKKKVVIRLATVKDLDAITEMEALCFPAAEAATREAFEKRLSVFANHFWLLEKDGKIISGINGMVTNEATLTDEMYADATMHDENGAWQMIFGVTTIPEYQGNGYAALLMKQVIADCSAQGRRGIVLTCKERLIKFYEQFGFINEGKSESEHGGATWYEMRLRF